METAFNPVIGTDEGQVEVQFVTKQPTFSVANTPYSIPANVTVDDLNLLLNTILAESLELPETVAFSFVIRGELLKQPLKQFLRDREISLEDHIEIEYFERLGPPEPENCLLHDDWVSAVQAQGDWILTGCYDNTLCLWDSAGNHKLTISGHEAPVKAVVWISLNSNVGIFASASQDQTIMIWDWNIKTNAVECIQVCKGHERGVDSVDVSLDKLRLASGSWDNMLKIWPATCEDLDTSNAKRSKTAVGTRTPEITLEGHREAISSVQWMDNHSILTASWDHTMKIWDLNMGAINHEMTGNKSFFCANYSALNQLIITASPDKNLKLYDPRSKQGTIVKSTFAGHTQWVQCVQWSKTDEHLFISGSYDNNVKLWDNRSPKAPLFDLKGHEDKVLCCDWTNSQFMMSGGSDNSLRIFKANNYAENNK